MLDKRLTELLSLLAQDEYKTLDSLSQRMGLSTKTVRGLIRDLDGQLKEHGAQILHQRGKGFLLEVNDLDGFQAFFLTPVQNIPSDSPERVLFLIEYFLKHDEYVKLESLCEMVFVSRKTLTADIKRAESFFSEFGLSLERKPHHGMRLAGDEFQKRRCMADYLQRKNKTQAGHLREEDSRQRQIAQCLLELLETEEYHITDVGLNSLVLHIDVAIRRIRAGQYISIPQQEYQELIGEADYALAQRCAEKIGQKFGLVFPQEEIRYLAIHFASKETNQNFVIDGEIQDTVTEMLEEIYQVFQMDFRDDLELTVALSKHLVPLVIRIRYGMRLKNPMLQEIRQRYSLAYTIALQSSAVLERRYQCILDSNEVAYLALTLELSLERRRTKIEKKRVLLVCASGAGTARLMAYKMQELYGDYIDSVTTCDQLNIGRQDLSKIDYIFTTVPIRERVPVPICEVKQFLEKNGTSGVRWFLNSGRKKDILRYYPRNLFFPDIEADTKEEALREIVSRVESVRKLPEGFYEAVLRREQMAHTCMGNRVAMPHPCRVMTEDTFISVSILRRPIQWDENNQVQAVFLVSVSKRKNKELQDFYSTTARLLLSRERIETLIEQRNYQALTECLDSVENERNE